MCAPTRSERVPNTGAVRKDFPSAKYSGQETKTRQLI